MKPGITALDHIRPFSEYEDNNGHVSDNLQWVLSEVNRAKGTMSQDDFISMCVEVAVHSGGCVRGEVMTAYQRSMIVYNG